MKSVSIALNRVWPTQLRTDRLLLRPVTREDGPLVDELLTDDRVRAHLGGPATQDRVVARQAAYPMTAGAFTVVRVADQRQIGLVTIGADHRCEGRAEISYQLLPAAWGEGLGREAVAAAVSWWTDAVPGGGPLVAVTQKANRSSCRMLEAIGMTVVDELDEHGRQCVYTPAGGQDDSDLRWLRLLAERRDAVERHRGAQARRRARPRPARTFPTTFRRSLPRNWPGCALPATAPTAGSAPAWPITRRTFTWAGHRTARGSPG
ncbi:GNAT family N-acetyltransferase [Streptomyces sp. NPDC006265]|uniref:GNAT family N-acetyltransferase n=1 Tax=Streptomyces sp. NPDC006265 TaxID=3156740 RepID=UPI0033AF92CD